MVFDSYFNPADREYVLISESQLLEAATDTSIGGVVVASSLSNLLVVKCIKHGVKAILTQERNIASHAANILRAANSSGKLIDWFYGVDVACINRHIGKKVYFSNDELRVQGETLTYPLKVKYNDDLISNNKSIATMNLNKNSVSYRFFPETYFTKFAFSLMKASLEKELRTWFSTESSVKLVKGFLEFENSPSLSEINQFACNVQVSEIYYLKMLENYSHIAESLRNNSWNYQNLCDNAERYYSTFLVLHRSYSKLFGDLERKLVEKIGHSSSYVYREILQSKIDIWLADENNVLINKKVFLQDEPIARIPDFSIDDDLRDSFERVRSVCEKLGLDDFYIQNKKWLKMYSIIFVLKEWKFVIYKIIFTHFKVLIKENLALACYSNEMISDMTKEEVAVFYE